MHYLTYYGKKKKNLWAPILTAVNQSCINKSKTKQTIRSNRKKRKEISGRKMTWYHLGDKAAGFPRWAGTAWSPRRCLWNYGWKLSRYHNHAKNFLFEKMWGDKCQRRVWRWRLGENVQVNKVKAVLRSWQLGNSNTVQTHSVKEILFKQHPKFDNTWHACQKKYWQVCTYDWFENKSPNWDVA
jgi:hypothetical protein